MCHRFILVFSKKFCDIILSIPTFTVIVLFLPEWICVDCVESRGPIEPRSWHRFLFVLEARGQELFLSTEAVPTSKCVCAHAEPTSAIRLSFRSIRLFGPWLGSLQEFQSCCCVVKGSSSSFQDAGNFGGPQNRPGAYGGPNKKERLSKLVVEGGKGHSFEWGTTKGVNCAINCKVCGFFIEQTAPLDKFRTLEEQPCAHVPCPWPAHWPKAPGHQIYNLGVVWICKRCHVTVRPAATKFFQKAPSSLHR